MAVDLPAKLAAADERLRAWSLEHPAPYAALELLFLTVVYGVVRGLLAGDLIESLASAPAFATVFLLFRILVYGWPLEGGLRWRRDASDGEH